MRKNLFKTLRDASEARRVESKPNYEAETEMEMEIEETSWRRLKAHENSI